MVWSRMVCGELACAHPLRQQHVVAHRRLRRQRQREEQHQPWHLCGAGARRRGNGYRGRSMLAGAALDKCVSTLL